MQHLQKRSLQWLLKSTCSTMVLNMGGFIINKWCLLVSIFFVVDSQLLPNSLCTLAAGKTSESNLFPSVFFLLRCEWEDVSVFPPKSFFIFKSSYLKCDLGGRRRPSDLNLICHSSHVRHGVQLSNHESRTNYHFIGSDTSKREGKPRVASPGFHDREGKKTSTSQCH